MKQIKFNRDIYYVWNTDSKLLSNPSKPQLGYLVGFIDGLIKVEIPCKNENGSNIKLFKYWNKV